MKAPTAVANRTAKPLAGDYSARRFQSTAKTNDMMNLVPLPLAARHVYLCVEDYAPNARPRERLDRLGRLMAQLGGLYVVEDQAVRPLGNDERARPGADIRVTHDCIEKAIDALRRR